MHLHLPLPLAMCACECDRACRCIASASASTVCEHMVRGGGGTPRSRWRRAKAGRAEGDGSGGGVGDRLWGRLRRRRRGSSVCVVGPVRGKHCSRPPTKQLTNQHAWHHAPKTTPSVSRRARLWLCWRLVHSLLKLNKIYSVQRQKNLKQLSRVSATSNSF